MRVLLFVASALVFFSCEQTKQKYDKSYFDFDSLVSAQVKVLAKSRWKKFSSLNHRSDTVMISPDSMRNELEIFAQLDVINKPIFKNRFSVEEKKDVHSNLNVRRYQFHEEEGDPLKSAVPYVDFYYYKQFSDLRKISAAINEKNILFNSKRKLSIEFEEGNQKKIVSYGIEGFQKMLLADSVNLSIKAIRTN